MWQNLNEGGGDQASHSWLAWSWMKIQDGRKEPPRIKNAHTQVSKEVLYWIWLHSVFSFTFIGWVRTASKIAKMVGRQERTHILNLPKKRGCAWSGFHSMHSNMLSMLINVTVIIISIFFCHCKSFQLLTARISHSVVKHYRVQTKLLFLSLLVPPIIVHALERIIMSE